VTRADAKWGKKGKAGPGMRAGPRSGLPGRLDSLRRARRRETGLRFWLSWLGLTNCPSPIRANPRPLFFCVHVVISLVDSGALSVRRSLTVALRGANGGWEGREQ
jgi:hypothetical protein